MTEACVTNRQRGGISGWRWVTFVGGLAIASPLAARDGSGEASGAGAPSRRQGEGLGFAQSADLRERARLDRGGRGRSEAAASFGAVPERRVLTRSSGVDAG